MKLGKKTDFSLESLTNNSTNLQPTSPTIDSPPAQEDSQDLLPSKGEVVPLITHKPSKQLKNKNKFGCLTWLTIFLGLGIGGVFLALPSLMSCINKAKASEGKDYIGAMSRAQQAYFLEYQKFTDSLFLNLPKGSLSCFSFLFLWKGSFRCTSKRYFVLDGERMQLIFLLVTFLVEQEQQLMFSSPFLFWGS